MNKIISYMTVITIAFLLYSCEEDNISTEFENQYKTKAEITDLLVKNEWSISKSSKDTNFAINIRFFSDSIMYVEKTNSLDNYSWNLTEDLKYIVLNNGKSSISLKLLTLKNSNISFNVLDNNTNEIGLIEYNFEVSNQNNYKLYKGNINKQNLTLDSNSVIYLSWTVSASSPDYSYFSNETNVNFNNTKFYIKVYDEVPLLALNNYTDSTKLGVAYITLFKKKLPLGKTFNIEFDLLHGIVNDRGLIYNKGFFENSTSGIFWINTFPQGLSFAKGLYKDVGFDGWELTTTENIELILITSRKDLKLPNWT